jgi:HEAT repeat protein
MDEELRLFALSQLMERDPERALPLVLDLMKNAGSEKVRNDAMFVLGMSEEPAAKQALARAAQNANDPKTQIGAIHMLGNLDASEELQLLYPTLQSSAAKVAVIEALSIQGESGMLVRYLENEQDPAIRKAAIYGLAMDGDSKYIQILESMYESSGSTEEKVAILESLALMDDAEGLALKILRTETDPQLKRQAIQMLGVMDANDSLLEIYPNASPEEKQAVIESMMIMENTKALVGLLEQETDPELKRQMLQMLAAIDSEESDEYLFRMLENSN